MQKTLSAHLRFFSRIDPEYNSSTTSPFFILIPIFKSWTHLRTDAKQPSCWSKRDATKSFRLAAVNRWLTLFKQGSAYPSALRMKTAGIISCSDTWRDSSLICLLGLSRTPGIVQKAKINNSWATYAWDSRIPSDVFRQTMVNLLLQTWAVTLSIKKLIYCTACANSLLQEISHFRSRKKDILWNRWTCVLDSGKFTGSYKEQHQPRCSEPVA